MGAGGGRYIGLGQRECRIKPWHRFVSGAHAYVKAVLQIRIFGQLSKDKNNLK
jgi:hypothetical protein